MKTVMVIGSGGRECCVAHTFAKSSQVGKVVVCPGNAGTNNVGKLTNVVPPSSDNAGLVQVAETVKPDLIFVGPEVPLVEGAVDELTAKGFRVFGPTKAASQLEASKAFSKEFFLRHNLPTATHQTFKDPKEAKTYVTNKVDWTNAPVVVKASGLCAGKGVFMSEDAESAVSAIEAIMEENTFGSEAGSLVVIEERLEGQEVSVLAFCDGATSKCMPPAQDHKRVGDGDTGPNTGGMGAYAPAPCVTPELSQEIADIVQRTLTGLKEEGTPFVGVLFAGFMLTKNGPKLLEYNVRMGDPETQVVLPLLNSDLYAVCDACISGTLGTTEIKWNGGRHAATIIMAAKGYPGSYNKDMPIRGLDTMPQDVTVFHAGTKVKEGKVVASGGRVLAVTGTGSTLQEAVDNAYKGVHNIHFDPEDSCIFRKDIAHRALPSGAKKPKVNE